MLKIFNYLFNRWTKWILYKENQIYIKEIYSSPVLGSYLISKNNVIVDIYYKENKFTSIKKYKTIEKK